mgnify:FL=1
MPLNLESKIKESLASQGATFVCFVDLSSLPEAMTLGFPRTILFGIPLTPDYLKKVINTPDYVDIIKRNKTIDSDEFHLTEEKTDAMADLLAADLNAQGWRAFSQSEKNLTNTGLYNIESKRSPLPHKTIARIAGLGRIGKNNLLINDRYGCALSMCSVLTDAPLDTNMLLSLPESASCGSCTICIDACKTGALRGNTWLPDRDRDEIINTQACTTCLLCMVLCPWSIKYMKQKLS